MMRLNNKNENKQLGEFIDFILRIEDKNEMKNFLEGILTPKELIEIPHRFEIIKLLKKGVSQHDIAGKLGVGVATVGRGSKELQNGRFQNV